MPTSTSRFSLSPVEQAVVDRAYEYAQGARDEPLTGDERAAMRAFLQRAETRLSTYQRVAGVFLNGAGLLVLLPAVARDTILSVVVFGIGSGWETRSLILIPWLVSLSVPLYAFILLLRDLVEFYFAPKFLSDDPVPVTRFSLAGISLSYDEGIEAKARAIASQVTKPHYAHFVLGESDDSRRGAKDAFFQSKAGNIGGPMRLALLRKLQGEDRTIEITDAELMTVALAVAGSLDSSLADEVSRVEASIARHVLALRRLVLRYTKALLLFVWTTLLSLVVVGILSPDDHASVETKLAAAIGVYAIWAATSIFLIRFPRWWIDRLAPVSGRGRASRRRALDDDSHKRIQDWDIRKFEVFVTRVLTASVVLFIGLFIGVAPWW